jgi:hypothetical protein
LASLSCFLALPRPPEVGTGYVLKGTGSPDGLRYFWYVWIYVGINTRRWWFMNFKVSPEAFHWNKPISSGKCEHKLAYNVSGLI